MPNSRNCPDFINKVKESYGRCQNNKEFFDIFYSILLGKSEEIKLKFQHTDWIRQHHLIKLGIKSAILYAENPDLALTQKNINNIGATHSHAHWDIKPDLYPLWLDSIAEAVQKCDKEYSPDLEDAWRKTLMPAIKLIISQY